MDPLGPFSSLPSDSSGISGFVNLPVFSTAYQTLVHIVTSNVREEEKIKGPVLGPPRTTQSLGFGILKINPSALSVLALLMLSSALGWNLTRRKSRVQCKVKTLQTISPKALGSNVDVQDVRDLHDSTMLFFEVVPRQDL